jgi:WD40 repeat protein
VLDVERGVNVDSRVKELLNILPTLGVDEPGFVLRHDVRVGQFIDEDERRMAAERGVENVAEALAYSHDGRTLAVAAGYGNVSLLDLASGKELPSPAKHKDWIRSVAFSPDDKLLVSAGGSEFRPERNGGVTTGEVKLWDRTTNAERGNFAGHTSKVFSAAFSPDGQTVATGSADQTVRLWDVATLKERAVLKGHTNAVWSVAFSPDGKIVASAGDDRSVKLWDAATQQELATLGGHDEEIVAVAFSPDGQTIATGGADWTIRLWNAATRQPQGVLKGHRGTVYCLAFSPDGTTLASGSADETVKLWDWRTGTERTTLTGHKSGVIALSFAPDNQSLATAGRVDPVRLWELTNVKP